MNKSRDILEYLKQPGSSHSLILAPNAPPIARTGNDVQVALNVVLDAEDVSDTLEHLHAESHPTGKVPALGKSGSFSFGRKGVGRIRVTYAMQRGSYVVSVTSIRFEIPKPHDLADSPPGLDGLLASLASGTRVFVAVSGPDSFSSTSLVYAMLQHVNENSRNVIAAIENSLTYLMGHANSVVMQAEIGSDAADVEEAIESAHQFSANIIFVNNIESEDDVPAIRHALARGNAVLVNATTMTPSELTTRYAQPVVPMMPPGADLKQYHIRVFPGADAKLDLRIEPVS